MTNRTVMDIMLQGLRRPKYSRVGGVYCCNDRECRREQNKAHRRIRQAKKHSRKYGSAALDWFFLNPVDNNVKPSKKGRRHGW